MSLDGSPDAHSRKAKRKARRSELRIVVDTNALYVTSNSIGAASDLLRQEIASVIIDSKYPDLDILWYLPEIVRHERQYQMQTEALKLRSAINKIERLLSHNLALTDDVLVNNVKTKISEVVTQLGLREIKLDPSAVDWPSLIHAAAYRKPPFQAGEKEKGFRDALVVESFLQLLANSPRTPNLCRVVLVTSDELLAEAVRARISDFPNASVLPNVDALRGLINTLVSDVREDFIDRLKPKASKLFFVTSTDRDTVFYKEKIDERLEQKFSIELKAKPPEAGYRDNGAWRIGRPNFSRKEGRRVFWTSRIEIEITLGTVVQAINVAEPKSSLGNLMTATEIRPFTAFEQLSHQNLYSAARLAAPLYTLGGTFSYNNEDKVPSHRGSDVFEVLWSAEVTMSKELKKPAIEDIIHVGLSYQPIS